MKKSTILMLFLLMLPALVQAADMSTSVPTGSQYRPGRNYGFQISLSDVSNAVNATLIFNGNNYLASNVSFNFYKNISNLAAGEYSYSWVVMNATDSLTFPGTYSVVKNSTLQITLTLDGKSANKSYKNNTVALFVVSLPVSNKTVNLESTYPGFETKTNSTSNIKYSLNLTSVGFFTATGSWSGDENYTGSSVSYNFDDSAPRITNFMASPESPVGYSPNVNYIFQSTVSDATLTNVWFESNYTGTMKSYYSNSNTSVQNSSGNFMINLGSLGARNFSYRWHAKDSLNQEAVTEFFAYNILKMNPLVMEVLPSSRVVEGTQVTVTCFSISQKEVNTSNFYLYKDYELIKSISPTTRLQTFLMTSGEHNFTCSTNGTANYTNQSITRTLFVTSNTRPEQQETEGVVEVKNVSLPVILAGNSGEASFLISNGLLRNVVSLSINVSGIPGDWYFVQRPDSINRNQTILVKINITIPSDAEGKSYPVSIRTTGRTTEGSVVDTTKISSIRVIGRDIDEPPKYSDTISQSIKDSSVIISLDITDDKGLSGYIFSSNITGSWENDTWIPLGGKSNMISITKPSQASSSVAWMVYVNDSSGQWSQTDGVTVTSSEIKTDAVSMIILIVLVVVVLAAVAIFVIIRPKEPEVKYVFKKEDIDEEN
jgi:hypothetical protein